MDKESILEFTRQHFILNSDDTIAYFGQISPDEIHIRLNVNKDGKALGQFSEVIKISQYQNWLSKSRQDKLEQLGI